MDRRDFLKTSGAAAAGLAAAVGATQPVPGAEATTLVPQAARPAGRSATRLVLSTTREPDVPGFAARRLAQRIETVSGGRYVIEISRNATGPDSADLTFGSAHEHARHHTAFAFFAGLPRSEGYDASSLTAWLAVGGGQMLWDDLAANFGIKPLLAGHTGASAGLWANRRLDTASDLVGLKLFATGLGADVARALGADVIEIVPHDLRAALNDGRIQAAEWLGPLAAIAPDLQPPAGRIYTPGLTPHGIALMLTVRRDLWVRMDAADQAMLEVCATAEYQAARAEACAHAMIESRLTASAQRLSFTPDLAAALDRAAGDAVERLAAADPVSRRIADSHRAFRNLMGAGVPHTS